ncbi:MAG: leucine-rich repeat domain-containing protein [Clostridia bacterium]|nr:leucine-rich repeat domain-containing protein [Clostridia bacterium]
MKKSIGKPNILLLLFLSAAILLSALVSCSERTGREAETVPRTEDGDLIVYGKEYPPDTAILSFTGDEIDGVDGLITVLSAFPDLEFVDLGTFPVSMEDAERIRSSAGGIDLKCRICETLYGKPFFAEDEVIDLSGAGITDTAELEHTLRYLPNARLVSCPDGVVSIEAKKRLREEYPHVEFDIPALADVFGTEVRDDVTELDLKSAPAGADLASVIEIFPDLESVDLHGVALSPEEQDTLSARFPSVRFLWEVDIKGEKYDSAADDLDLSGTYGLTPDDVREIIPKFHGLKRLDLSDCGMDNETLAALRDEFPNTKIVWTLYMGQWSLKTDAVAFSVLIYNYKHTRLRNEDIEILKYTTDLQALDLGHQAITDITAIAEYCPELRILILADNCLHDIEPVRKLKHLHYIELFVNPYLNDITPLEDCKELVDVNVSHLYTISDIHGLLDLPILERLWIEHTATTQADIQLLRDTYPNAEVVDQGYGSVDQGWRTHPRYFAMINMYFDTTYISEEFSKYDGAD